MDNPRRKSIRLAEYDYKQKGAYFVTVCTHNRAELFGEISCEGVGAHPCVRPSLAGTMVAQWVQKIPAKYAGVTVDKFMIMPDHIHLLIQIRKHDSEHSLSEIMKWLKAQTTNMYIRMVKDGDLEPFDGHVWQRNYYEHAIRGETDYYDIWEYIENNPLKWVQTHGELRNGRTHGCAPTTLKDT